MKTGFYLDRYYLQVFEVTDYSLSKGLCKNPEEQKPEDEDYEDQLYIILNYNFFLCKEHCLAVLEEEKQKKFAEFSALCLNYIDSVKLLT